LGSSNG